MAQQFTNNARALLVAGIGSTDTSFVVESAKADLFPTANTGTNPVPAATNWFKATLQNAAGAVEIVYVRTRTAGSGIMSSVLRGQEGTTALSFLAGTIVGLRVTAADIQNNLDIANQNSTFSGNNTFSGDNTFSGANTFPTQSAGNNTTLAATTAFVQTALQAVYPVGSIYINAGVTTNPATLLGFGTWAAFGAGRVMVGLNGSDTLFDALEETGGSKDAIVVSHNHTGTVDSNGSHAHTTNYGFSNDHDYFGNGVSTFTYNGGGVTQNPYPYSSEEAGAHNHSFTTNAAGSSGTNANLQPYITVAMWKRTA